MISIQAYTPIDPPTPAEIEEVVSFLFVQLEEYGDPLPDIRKAVNYALSAEAGAPGGLLITARKNSVLTGAVITNRTGMSGYIPENILVYIATHNQYRGQGIGRQLMARAIESSKGDIALHVEPDNPALRLYESLGFTNKYLEMRLKK